MRLIISLLLLALVIHQAQGIRLLKETPTDNQHNIQKILRSNDGVEEVISCKGKHCSGRSRKLVTPISSTTTIVKKDENEAPTKSDQKVGSKEGKLSVNSTSNEPRKRVPETETYPDILDIAGMDYSQAKRKPPIHN